MIGPDCKQSAPRWSPRFWLSRRRLTLLVSHPLAKLTECG